MIDTEVAVRKDGTDTLNIEAQIKDLEEAGMEAAAKALKTGLDRKRRLAIAYEHYRFVTHEKMEAYRARLKKATYKPNPQRSEWGKWKDLSFTPLEMYQKVPPPAVLKAIKEARGRKCFDSFSVAHIVEVKDPIVFGRIQNCTDSFFIARWDDDVRIEDILLPNEG